MKISYWFFSLAIVSLASCHSGSHHKMEEAVFKVASPVQKDTVINNEYVSQIHAYQNIELRALEKGYLQKIFVDEGQSVQKGQRLFQIQPTIYQSEVKSSQSEVQSAQAEVEFASVEYSNALALAEKDIISQNEVSLTNAKLHKAQAELERTKAELSLAQTHLGFTEIIAPFDGIVGKFEDVRLGSLLDEGELLTTLTDNSKMWVYFNVPESQYLDYAMLNHDGDEKQVYLKLANQKVYQEQGVIEVIESNFDNTTGNIAFRASFPNPKKLLRHGQTGNILWPEELENVIMIPQKSTFEVLDKKFVFVVNKDGKISSREIKIAGELDHLYFVSAGLKTDEQILLEGLRKVQNGDTVHYKKVPDNEVLESLHLQAE